MERRQYITAVGSLIMTGLAGCGQDRSNEGETPTANRSSNGEGGQQSFPDQAQQLLLEVEDFEEENWSLVKKSNSREGWFTHELERTDDEGRLNVIYSDVWIYDNTGIAADEYESRKTGYQERYETEDIDIGEGGVGWETKIAVALFHERDVIGQVEYHVYDDGELSGATLNKARSYGELMYQDW